MLDAESAHYYLSLKKKNEANRLDRTAGRTRPRIHQFF